MRAAERIRVRLTQLDLQLSEKDVSPEDLCDQLLDLFGPEYRADMEELLQFCRQDPRALSQALLAADRELRADSYGRKTK